MPVCVDSPTSNPKWHVDLFIPLLGLGVTCNIYLTTNVKKVEASDIYLEVTVHSPLESIN